MSYRDKTTLFWSVELLKKGNPFSCKQREKIKNKIKRKKGKEKGEEKEGDLPAPSRRRAGFKKLTESDTTQPIRNRLGANRVDTVTRYETESGSAKTRWTRPILRNDSVKISENTENHLHPKKKTKNANF